MLLSRLALPRAAPRALSSISQRRGMAGGFKADMAVKKNYVVEEWNGKREITERTFEVTTDTIPVLVMFCMVVPYGIYSWSRSEFLSRGDRRYKELV